MKEFMVIVFWAVLTIAIELYFLVRGVIEGMVFSERGIDARTYHVLRFLESAFVVGALLLLKFDLRILAIVFFGLSLYEYALSVAQYGTFPPREPFVYRILWWKIFVTPSMKFWLTVGYFVVGLVLLVLGTKLAIIRG